MPDEPTLGVLAGGGLGTLMVVVYGLWDRFFRAESKHNEDARREREAERAGLNERQRAIMDGYERAAGRAESDTDRERKRRLDVEAEADDLSKRLDDSHEDVRAWKLRAHALKHELENTRTIVDHLMEARGLAPIVWFDETLPLLTEIRADNLDRTKRYADWRLKQATLRSKAAVDFKSAAITEAIGQFLIPVENVDEE